MQSMTSQVSVEMSVILVSFLLCLIGSSLSYHQEKTNGTVFAASSETLGNNQHAGIGSKRCMRDLGCFELTSDFFHYRYRPINLLPQDRATIDTKFKAYTKEYKKETHLITANDPESFEEAVINPEHETKFIVHGFFDNTLYGKWMEQLKDNLLLHGDYNVIIVDWSKGNGLPYTQATANTRVVGAEIALLINALQKALGINPKNCHVIGHSLGSHIAGYAGKRLERLGRITALDPAQPYFQNMPPSVRVDRKDAVFVDVIHTDSASQKFLALGMSQAVGHVDFYPNNGMNQPGCTYNTIHSVFLEGLFEALRRFVSCNHQRAVDFFVYSINYKKVLPIGYQCSDWQNYLHGRCSDCGRDNRKCAIMGIQADAYKPYKNDSQSIKLYLKTTGDAPFWAHTYNVVVKLAKPPSYSDRSGEMRLKIQGSKSVYDKILTTRTGELIHGSTYSFIVDGKDDLGTLQTVSFSWTSNSFGGFIFKHTIYLDYVQISPMSTNSDQLRKKNTKKLCWNANKAIASKEEVVLSDCK